MVWNITWGSDTKKGECFSLLLIGFPADCRHLLLFDTHFRFFVEGLNLFIKEAKARKRVTRLTLLSLRSQCASTWGQTKPSFYSTHKSLIWWDIFDVDLSWKFWQLKVKVKSFTPFFFFYTSWRLHLGKQSPFKNKHCQENAKVSQFFSIWYWRVSVVIFMGFDLLFHLSLRLGWCTMNEDTYQFWQHWYEIFVTNILANIAYYFLRNILWWNIWVEKIVLRVAFIEASREAQCSASVVGPPPLGVELGISLSFV